MSERIRRVRPCGSTTVPLAVACLLGLLALPAVAQEDQGASQGVLPLPDYSGDWRTRESLSGDWGGTRSEWADKGIFLEFDWLQVGQGIVSGGSDETWAYATNLDLYLKVDLDRMGVLPGAVVSFRGQSRFGRTVNGDSGLLLPVNTYSYFPYTSTIDENVPFAITELNYLQFVSEKLGFLLGKITTLAGANEFAGGEGRSQFMNFQFNFPAIVAQVAPYSTLAVGVMWMPTPKVTVTSMLFNATDSSTSWGFSDIDEGTSWSISADVQYRLGDLPGGSTFHGIYAFNGDFARIGGINIDPEDGITIEQKSEAWAFYWSGWQYVFVEEEAPAILDPRDGRQDLEGLGVFVTLGVGDRDTNPVSFSGAVGLGGRGTIPGRSDDTWGVAYFYNDLQDPRSVALIGLSGSVQGVEVYYNVAIAESIALTLDFQWTQSALPGVDPAVILGLRLNVRF
jgi:porin